jgi:hypothetical protein
MASIPTISEDNDIVDAGAGNQDDSNEKRIDHEASQPQELEEQASGILDSAVTNSNILDWMSSPMEFTSSSARFSEEQPMSRVTMGFSSCMLAHTDFPPFVLHPHRNEAVDSFERLIDIIDMALGIVNGN